MCVVDKRLVQGRSQEWNISRAELQSLARVGLLSDAELQQCVVSEYNPIRVGFKGGLDLLVTDCLNLGVSPRVLLDKLRAKVGSLGSGSICLFASMSGPSIATCCFAVTAACRMPPPARRLPLALPAVRWLRVFICCLHLFAPCSSWLLVAACWRTQSSRRQRCLKTGCACC